MIQGHIKLLANTKTNTYDTQKYKDIKVSA